MLVGGRLRRPQTKMGISSGPRIKFGLESQSFHLIGKILSHFLVQQFSVKQKLGILEDDLKNKDEPTAIRTTLCYAAFLDQETAVIRKPTN